jgi:hypothetical protein
MCASDTTKELTVILESRLENRVESLGLLDVSLDTIVAAYLGHAPEVVGLTLHGS